MFVFLFFQHLYPDPENRILKTDPDSATLKSLDPQPLPCPMDNVYVAALHIPVPEDRKSRYLRYRYLSGYFLVSGCQ